MINLKYVRLPYSPTPSPWIAFLEAMGFIVTAPNLNSQDYLADSKSYDRITSTLEKGKCGSESFIVIQSAGVAETLNRMNELIDFGRNKGYRFVGIDECLGSNIRMPADFQYTPKPPTNEMFMKYNGTIPYDAENVDPSTENSSTSLEGSKWIVGFTLFISVIVSLI